MIMADNSWRDLELWERVKWARRRQFESATAAAMAAGMKDGTYRCYERGPGSAKFITLDYKYAKKFAQLFKVRWEWLLDGTGEPWLTPPRDEEEQVGPPNNLRVWREYRGLSVSELAKKAKTSAQTITDLESGAVELSRKWLDTLAPPLNTTPGRLLDLNPYENDPEILDTFSAIPKERRPQVLQIIQTFKPYNRLK
jgi:transcriptional regulator with XRE-family HTH domain